MIEIIAIFLFFVFLSFGLHFWHEAEHKADKEHYEEEED